MVLYLEILQGKLFKKGKQLNLRDAILSGLALTAALATAIVVYRVTNKPPTQQSLERFTVSNQIAEVFPDHGPLGLTEKTSDSGVQAMTFTLGRTAQFPNGAQCSVAVIDTVIGQVDKDASGKIVSGIIFDDLKTTANISESCAPNLG